MDPQPAVRVVRPRPLGLTDRIPVYWAGQEPTQELKQIDGGALYRHLVAAGTPTTSKKRKRGHKYQAPKEGAPHEHFTGLEPQQQQQQLPEAAGPIHIPRVRDVSDYGLNREAAAHHGPMIEGDMATAPYLRHKEHQHVYDDHHSAEYDADDEDIAWLDKINSKNGQSTGILAAAIGLYHQVSARISRSSDHSTGSEAQHQQQPLLLAVDDFERAIELLEKAHFDAVKAWWDEEQAGPSTSAPRVPTIPAMKTLLPRATALDVLSELVPDRKLAAQLLDYWLKKRAQEGGPLLARLWFEQPWKLVAFAHDIVDDVEDFDEHLPFMAVEPRSKQKTTRRGGQRRRLREEDALEALHSLRNELETVRTLADQVRKREKLKKQLLLVSQQEWQARRQLGLPPGKAAVAAARKAAGIAQQAGTSKAAAAAAGTSKAGAAAAAGRAGLSAVRTGTATGPSPRAAAGGAFGQAGGAAGRAAAAVPSPPGSPNTVLNRALARVALAAAAAASPHEGDKGRQTRTSAAAAAAEFDATFAAKRRRLLAAKELADLTAAAAAAGGTGAAAAAAAGGSAEAGPSRLQKRGQPAGAAAAAAAGSPAEAGPSRLQKRGQPAAAAAAASKPPQAAAGRAQARGGRRKGGAAAAAAGAREEEEVSEQAPSGSPSADSEADSDADSEAEYAADDDELSSDDTELPSGLVYETAAIAGQQQQARKGRQKPLREKRLGRGRASSRAAAVAARAATAGQIAAEEASSGFILVSDDSSSDEEEGGSVQGVQQRVMKGRQGRRQQQQQQAGKVQQKQQPNHAAAGARGPNRRNGLVGRGAAVLPPVASTSELQEAAAADSGSESDSFMQPSKKRRRQAGAGAAAAAGPAPPAAAAAADTGRQRADAPQVLKPLNQQPSKQQLTKQLRSNADTHKGMNKPISQPAAAAVATGAVAASSGRGAAVPRPVSGGNKGHGSGGSVRRSTAGAAAARRKPVAPKRRQRGGNELRSLGVAAPVGPRRKAP